MDRRVDVRINYSFDEVSGHQYGLEVDGDAEVEVTLERNIQAVGTNGSISDLKASSRFCLRVGQKETAVPVVADIVNSNSTQTGQPGSWDLLKAVKLRELGMKLFAEATVKVLFKAFIQCVVWPVVKYVLLPLLAAIVLWLAAHSQAIDTPNIHYNDSPVITAGLLFCLLVTVKIYLYLAGGCLSSSDGRQCRVPLAGEPPQYGPKFGENPWCPLAHWSGEMA